MKGDVFFNACYNNAIGDIIGSCELNLPYSPGRIEMLNNQVEIAAQKVVEEAARYEEQVADYENCKRKLFCLAGVKKDRMNAQEPIVRAARWAEEQARDAADNAERLNDEAEERYDDCIETQIYAQQEAEKLEIEKQKAQMAFNIEEKKVSNVGLEVKKDYALYGLIALGAAAMVVPLFLLKR